MGKVNWYNFGFVCELCPVNKITGFKKAFLHRRYLKVHMRKIHGIQEETYN